MNPDITTTVPVMAPATTQSNDSSSLLIFTTALILVVIIILVMMFSDKSQAPRSQCNERAKRSKGVWSGLIDNVESVVTPMRRRTVPENDAPLSMTVSNKYVQHEFGKFY